MTDTRPATLLKGVLEAHGGLARWRTYDTVADGFAVALTRRAYLTDDIGDVARDEPMVAMRFADVTFSH